MFVPTQRHFQWIVKKCCFNESEHFLISEYCRQIKFGVAFTFKHVTKGAISIETEQLRIEYSVVAFSSYLKMIKNPT